MRIFFQISLFILLLPIVSFAQSEDQGSSLDYLKSEYLSASVVVHVRVREAKVIHKIGGYENWHLMGDVIESFKGQFRKGDEIQYDESTDSGFKKELFLGEKILFLVPRYDSYDKGEKRWGYTAIKENSTIPYTEDRVEKLKIIKRSAQPKK